MWKLIIQFGFRSKNIEEELCFAQLSKVVEKKHIISEEASYVHLREFFLIFRHITRIRMVANKPFI